MNECPAIILTARRLEFPDGRMVDIDSIWRGQVCYAVLDQDGDVTALLRRPITEFIDLARAENGTPSRG